MADIKYIYSGPRGIGFVIAGTYPSLDAANKAITTIPLYHYIIINNRDDMEEHGTLYQKNYDSKGAIVLKEVLKIQGPIPDSVYAENVYLLDADLWNEYLKHQKDSLPNELQEVINTYINKSGSAYTLKQYTNAIYDLLKAI